jgi:hypothetical protein
LIFDGDIDLALLDIVLSDTEENFGGQIENYLER